MNHTPDATPDALPDRIRARVHGGALQRVTRMFAANLTDALVETLQNCRRAGATRVCVTIDAPDGAPSDDTAGALTITVTDDGAGIVDPAVLLSFGETGWDTDLAGREDAAGMGFASHARQGCQDPLAAPVPGRSCPAGLARRSHARPFPGGGGGAHHPRRQRALAPRHRRTASRRMGTARRSGALWRMRPGHYPLPVTFEGETVPSRAFLDGAVHAEPWRGLVFGVFAGRNRGYNEPDLNFHGLTLLVRLPTVDPVSGQAWSVRAEVVSCPELELVLPARKEAVETEFLKEVREAARIAIYRAMAAADPVPRIAFEDWTRAQAAGIELPIPAPQLRPWRPCIADIDDWREGPGLASVSNDALVMQVDPEPPEAQAFWRAARRNGFADRLFETDRRLDGYGWFDALDRIENIHTEITADGKTSPLHAFPLPERTGAPLPARPEAIRMSLAVKPAQGPGRILDIKADLAFAGEAWSWVGDAISLVTADSDLDPGELALLLRAGFFSPSGDADADSHETQGIRFDEEALHVATRLLFSDEEARRTSIVEAVRRELMWLVPRDRAVDIAVRGREVTVMLGEPVEEAAR